MTPFERILTLTAHEKEPLSLFFAYSSRSIFFLQHSLQLDSKSFLCYCSRAALEHQNRGGEREREKTVTARLIIFLDDGGVLNDNRARGLQWQRLVGEYFVPLLGGSAEAWSRANRVVANRLFEPGAWRKSLQAAADYRSFDRACQVEWLRGMCELVGIETPPEEECLRLARRAAAFITRRVHAAFPGVVDTIRTLHRQGYPLHTASGESSLELEGYLQAMGVRDCFGRLYGPDLIETLKEGPEYYERIFADLGIAATEALVVDDSADALGWASQLRAATILVSSSLHRATSTNPQLESLTELPAFLQRRQ